MLIITSNNDDNNFSIIPEEKAKEVSLDILRLDPYQADYYIAFVKKYLKNSREIIAVANYFGVDLTEGLSAIVKSVALANMGSSFDDIIECRKLIDQVVKEMGFPERSKKTAEQAIQVKCVAMLRDYAEKNMGNTEKDILELKNRIDGRVKEFALSPDNTASLYKYINDNLSKYDTNFRTLMGFTFSSRDYAATNRKVIEENKDILYKKPHEYIYRRDYLENIEKIKRVPMDRKLISQFIGMQTRLLDEFDKKCQNAKLYDDKLRGKSSMKGFMQSMMSNEADMKKDWLEVTHNGQYSIYDIMGIK